MVSREDGRHNLILSHLRRGADVSRCEGGAEGTTAVSIGLLALLDDIVGLAKIATASIDDVIGQATKAGAKAAGVVIDDAAVTPRYVVGFAAARELSIVRKIAFGSLKNKLLFLLPAALALRAYSHRGPSCRSS
jgi:hypothetical protein